MNFTLFITVLLTAVTLVVAAYVFVVDHAEYEMELLLESLLVKIELFADVFYSVNIVSGITNNIRITVHLLPTSH